MPRSTLGIVVLALTVTLSHAATASPHNQTQPAPTPEYRVLQDRSDRLIVELPNRLIILAAEVHAAPVVSAQVWVKTGSIYEQEHVGAGLSHFLEHLLAGGSTSTRTEQQTNAILSTIGAQTNAATSLDTVRYYINTTSPHAHQAIDLLSDWMLNSKISHDEYERERSVIQREFEMGQGEPDRILWKLTQQARYTHHPARHPTIGYLDQFLAVTRDEIYDFYKRMYVPNNMVFVVTGDIDKQRVVDQIAEFWSDQPTGKLPAIELPIEAPLSAPRKLAGTADIDKPRLRLAWPGTRLAADGDYALDLLATILGQGESSRLVRTVRDEQRAVNTISAYNFSTPWGEGFFGIDAQVVVPPAHFRDQSDRENWQTQQIDAAKNAILDQVTRIRDQGVTDQELARAKRKTMAAVIYNAQSAQALASRLAGDLIGMKDPDYLQRYAQAVQSLTADQVRQAAVRFLDPDRLITINLTPQAPNQPVTSLTRPAKPDTNDTQHEPIDLDNAAIIDHLRKQTHDDDQQPTPIRVEPIQRFELPNGLRLLVGRSTIAPAVSIQMYHLGGLLADPTDRLGLSNAASSMRVKGTDTRSAQQIAQLVEDLGASLDTGCGYNSTYTHAVCLKQDWNAVLELIADVTLHPTFPADEWAKLQPRLIAAIDRQTDSWVGELRLHFRQAYFGDHPWSHTTLGSRDAVESFTPNDLLKHHRARLDASQCVLAVFGDVDPKQVADRVQKLFADMPRQISEPFDPPTPIAPDKAILRIKTTKPLAAVQIGFGPTANRVSPDYAPLQVLSRVLNRFPSGWLEQELRGRGPGLVYAVGAGQFTGLVPGYFAVMFNTQPDTATEALDRAMGVVKRARETRVDDTTLAAAKAAVLVEELLYKQTNSQRAAEAAISALYGLSPDEPKRFRQQVRDLDAASLQAIAQKYLVNPVTIVLSHEPAGQQVDPAAATQPNAN